eukprot:2595809-Rhodomonas_salina.1
MHWGLCLKDRVKAMTDKLSKEKEELLLQGLRSKEQRAARHAKKLGSQDSFESNESDSEYPSIHPCPGYAPT